MAENNESNTLYNGPGFNGLAFQKECNEKINKIKEKLVPKDKLNDIGKKIYTLVENPEWMNKYIVGLSNYAKSVLNGETKQNNYKYKNSLTQYIDDVRNQYKECIEHARKNFDKVSSDVISVLKEEDLKQVFEENNKNFREKFSEASANFKKQLYNLKKYGGTKSAYRIETLKHNLLYCKKDKDEKSSNKLGFLDYLYFIIGNSDEVFSDSVEVSDNSSQSSSVNEQENISVESQNVVPQEKNKSSGFFKKFFSVDNFKKFKEASSKFIDKTITTTKNVAEFVKNKTLSAAKSVRKTMSNIFSEDFSKKLREPFICQTLDSKSINDSVEEFVKKLNDTSNNFCDNVDFKKLDNACCEFTNNQIEAVKKKVDELFSSNPDDKKSFLGNLKNFLSNHASSIQEEIKKYVSSLKDKNLSNCLVDCMTAQVSCNLIKGFHLESSSAEFYKDNRGWIVKTWGKMKKIVKFFSIIAAVGSLVLGVVSLLMGNFLGIGAICSSLIALFKIFWSDIKIKSSSSKSSSGFFEKIGAAKKIIF